MLAHQMSPVNRFFWAILCSLSPKFTSQLGTQGVPQLTAAPWVLYTVCFHLTLRLSRGGEVPQHPRNSLQTPGPFSTFFGRQEGTTNGCKDWLVRSGQVA